MRGEEEIISVGVYFCGGINYGSREKRLGLDERRNMIGLWLWRQVAAVVVTTTECG